MAKKPIISDTFDFDRLCRAFGLNDNSDEFMEMHDDYFNSIYEKSYKKAIESGAEDREAERTAERAREYSKERLYSKYIEAAYGTIKAYADKYFELNVEQKNSDKYKVSPIKDWETSLGEIIVVMEWMGHADYGGEISEFLRIEPYTMREGVLTYMHYLRNAHIVYGGSSRLHPSLNRKFRDMLNLKSAERRELVTRIHI